MVGRRMGKLLAVLLCVFMAVTLLPGTAVAAVLSVTVGGEILNATTPYLVNGNAASSGAGNCTAYFKDGVLRLNGLSNCSGINADGDLTIELYGGNSVIQAGGFYSTTSAIHVEGSLTIRGSGALTVKSGNIIGSASGSSYGISASDGITIEGDAAVNVTGGTTSGTKDNDNSYGLYTSDGGITIKDNAVVNATGGNSEFYYSYGIYGSATGGGNGIAFNGGVVVARAGMARNSFNSSCRIAVYAESGGIMKGSNYDIIAGKYVTNCFTFYDNVAIMNSGTGRTVGQMSDEINYTIATGVVIAPKSGYDVYVTAAASNSFVFGESENENKVYVSLYEGADATAGLSGNNLVFLSGYGRLIAVGGLSSSAASVGVNATSIYFDNGTLIAIGGTGSSSYGIKIYDDSSTLSEENFIDVKNSSLTAMSSQASGTSQACNVEPTLTNAVISAGAYDSLILRIVPPPGLLVTPDAGNAAKPGYTYSNGVLTITEAGNYTIGMNGVESSSDRIVVDTPNDTDKVTLRLDGVSITAPDGADSAIPNGEAALFIANGSVTLDILSNSRLTGGNGAAGDNPGSGGNAIDGSVTVTGFKDLALTGGEGGDGASNGVGISGTLAVTSNYTIKEGSSATDINTPVSSGGTATARYVTVTFTTPAPTFTCEDLRRDIFANGAPLLLTAGKEAKYTVVYIDKGTIGKLDSEDIIFDPDGEGTAYDGTTAGNDLSSYLICGGSDNIAYTGNTSITMLGGIVSSINGGSSSGVTGDATITITGGTVYYNLISKNTGKKTLTVGGSAKIGLFSTGIIINGGKINGNEVTHGFDSFAIAPALTGGNDSIYICLAEGFDKDFGTTIATGATADDLAKLKLDGSGAAEYRLELNGTDAVLKCRVTVGRERIFANGAPLLLVAGRDDQSFANPRNTVIYIDKDRSGTVTESDKIFDPDGGGPLNDTTAGNDLEGYTIYGGSNNTEYTGDTFITMLNGMVESIIGGSSGGGSVSGRVTIKISGGSVNNEVLANDTKAADSKSLTIGGNVTIGSILMNCGEVQNGFDSFIIDKKLTGSINVNLSEGFNAASGTIIATYTAEDDLDLDRLTLVGDGKADYELKFDSTNNTIKLFKPHKHSVSADCSTGAGAETFTEWMSNNSMPSTGGSYYLIDDVTLGSTWTVSGTVNLCLNGHKLDAGGGDFSVITVSEGATLNICDCNGSNGEHAITSPVTGEALTISGGLITGGKGTDSVSGYNFGGGVYNDGSFTLYGGTIAGNTATIDYASFAYGAGIYNNGTLNLLGGSVCHNKALGNGGGIYMVTGSTLNISGKPVVADNGSSSTVKSNLYLTDNPANITAALTDGAKIWVAFDGSSSPFTVAQGSGYTATKADSEKFFSDSSDFMLRYDEEAKTILFDRLYNLTLTDSSDGITGFMYSSTGGDDWTAYDANDPLKLSSGGSIYIKAELAEGYSFEKWADGLTANPYKIEGISKNISYTPTATKDNLSLTLNAVPGVKSYHYCYINNDGSTGNWIPYKSTTFRRGDDIYIKAELAEGYSFVEWADGLTDNPLKITNITDDIEYTPVLSKNKCLVTLTAAPNITGFRYKIDGAAEWTAYDAAFSVTYGAKLKVEALLADGYRLVKWADGLTANPLTIESVSGDVAYAPTVEKISLPPTEPEKPAYILVFDIPEDGGGSAESALTVPVTGGTTVSASAAQTGSSVSLSLTDEQLSELLAPGTGEIVIDLSSLGEINEVRLPAAVIQAIGAADVRLTIKTKSGTLSFDAEALDAACAAGGDLRLIIKKLSPADLTDRQRLLLGDDTLVYDLQLWMGGTQLHDFAGGGVTVSIPSEGTPLTSPLAWRVTEENGNPSLSPLNTAANTAEGYYSFTTPTFSLYAIGSFPFTDVGSNEWYYEAVVYVYLNGLIDGKGDAFEPLTPMTRATLVTALWRLEGEPVVNYILPFADVAASSGCAEAVRWAASVRLISGIDAVTFAPDAPLTRE